MRIPLDYYRILGLPLAASGDQLRQAYSDRIVQLPRREYSTAAISSRKQLIEEAFVVLSDTKKRSTYDQHYLAHAYNPDHTAAKTTPDKLKIGNFRDEDAQSLSIEIAQGELVGALLILQELGEYELVLKLGRPYLVNKNSGVDTKTGNYQLGGQEENSTELPDIILTVALACLELGREQWQQGHYENAAISLETGAELLVKQEVFPSIQAEITADLCKLRPYRILELLALPLEKTAERRQGLELLQNILEDRGGIDGTGNDESGLNMDDFLRFIQQLRHHLTVAEQHKLFEAQSQRPSAVATYLAVYALIARGFAQRQPALIRQAKQMLMRLGKRQDVHLEQSLCALLLGQTEEATRVLEMSQEYEALAFIREKSQDSPDLLPGLCLYGEQWLQQEVFLHFRDLTKQQASLKDYFADQQVQAYLEALPTDAQLTNDWDVINQQSFPQSSINQPNHRRNSHEASQPLNHHYPSARDSTERFPRESSEYFQISSPPENTSGTSTPSSSQKPETSRTQSPIEEPRNRRNSYQSHNATPNRNPKPKRRHQNQTNNQEQVGDETRSPVTHRRQRPPRRRRSFLNTLEGKTRLVWTVLVSLLCILVLWLLISTTFGWLKNIFFPKPSLQGEQLAIQINQPVIEIPDGSSKPQSPSAEMTSDTAKEVIRTWLSVKVAALGA